MSHRRTILVVEDDPDLRDAIELILHRQGYHVVATGDGLRAVELADQQKVDVALVDLLIPGQSGFQVATSRDSAWRGRAIVIMSGNASPAHQDFAFAAGANISAQTLHHNTVAGRDRDLLPTAERPPSGSYHGTHCSSGEAWSEQRRQ